MEQIVLLIALWYWTVKFVGPQMDRALGMHRVLIFLLTIIGFEIPIALMILLAQT